MCKTETMFEKNRSHFTLQRRFRGANILPSNAPVSLISSSRRTVDQTKNYSAQETAAQYGGYCKVEVGCAPKEEEECDLSRADTNRLFTPPVPKATDTPSEF